MAITTENRYRLRFDNGEVFKEAVLIDSVKEVSIGTDILCDIRFHEEEFYRPFKISLSHESNKWIAACEPGLAIQNDFGLSQKAVLEPGNSCTIVYSENEMLVFYMEIVFDVDYYSNKYDRVIQMESMADLTIGGSNAMITLPYNLTKDDLISIENRHHQFYLNVIKEGFGTFLNGALVHNSVRLRPFDFISVGPYSFCFIETNLYTDADNDLIYAANVIHFVQKDSLSFQVYPHFHPSPRQQIVLDKEPIKILDPPTKPQPPESNIVGKLLPTVAMLGIVTLSGLSGRFASGASFMIMSLGSVGAGMATSIYSIYHDKKRYKEQLQEREETYERYINGKKESIQQTRLQEKEDLYKIYYSVSEEIDIVDGFLPQLYDRNPKDPDFMEVRLGLGVRKAVKPIDIRDKEEFEMDELQVIPSKLAEEYESITPAPIVLELNKINCVGIYGKREALYQILKNMTLDLAVRQSDQDLQLVYCIGDGDEKQFSWLRFLPHLQNRELNRRNIICDEESRNLLLEYFYKKLSQRDKTSSLPHIVFMIWNQRDLLQHPIIQMLKYAGEKGVTFLFFEEEKEYLPKDCDVFIKMDDLLKGSMVNRYNDKENAAFEAEPLSDGIMRRVVQKLAPVYRDEIQLAASMNAHLSFFEMWNIYHPEDLNILQIWNQSDSTKSLSVPLGIDRRNETAYLDISERYDGPHGLVAGTTGSGKSELLSTFILSMAMKYHPNEVGFVLIDFKGGGMAYQFRDLPHVRGTISNIEEKEINRSLSSIQAELKKRQRLFAQYEVNHIDAYIRLFKQGKAQIPLPHLIVIVDEFAELKQDHPEFMKELVSASRIGRSLGVHLILATQKPSGVVDPQIWSNSRFKICLKVQSREDSNEVLKNPLAAQITEPGRAYIQIGNNEKLDLIQSAYSGASSEEGLSKSKEFNIYRLNLSGKRTLAYERKREKREVQETQLDSIIDHIHSVYEKGHFNTIDDICLPPLVDVMNIQSTVKTPIQNGIVAELGIYDDPAHQAQLPYTLNLTQANTMIIGSAYQGKTNLLQVLVRQLAQNYSPDEVNLYILDFGSMVFRNFESLHHVGDVIYSYEEEKLKNFVKMMQEEIARRKERFIQTGVSSYASWLEAGFTGLPQIVVCVDGLTALRELYLVENDFLLPLCRDGLSVGISFVISNSQTSGIGYRYLTNFAERIALFCNNSSEYVALFEHCRMTPKNTPGRGLVEIDKSIYEVQTYLAFEGDKEIQRKENMEQFVEEVNSRYPDMYAPSVPMVPAVVTKEVLEKKFHAKSTAENPILGIGYETVEPVTLSIMRHRPFVLCGSDTERQSFLAYFVDELKMLGASIYAIDDIQASLAKFGKESFTSYTAQTEGIGDVLGDMEMDLMDKKPLYVLLIQNREAIQTISQDRSLLNFYQSLFRKYAGYPIFVMFTNFENKAISFNADEVLKMMKNQFDALYFGQLKDCKLVDITMSTLRKYKKAVEDADAFFIEGSNLSMIKTCTK